MKTTQPNPAQSLIEQIERYGFECDGGRLENAKEWLLLKSLAFHIDEVIEASKTVEEARELLEEAYEGQNQDDITLAASNLSEAHFIKRILERIDEQPVSRTVENNVKKCPVCGTAKGIQCSDCGICQRCAIKGEHETCGK